MNKEIHYGMMMKLSKLALPVIGANFLSMAYNFINMVFVGRLGSDSVAALGTAGFYLHLSWAVSSLITIGAGIKVSHSMGKKNENLTKSYINVAFKATAFIATVYVLFIAISGKFLIGLIQLNDCEIEKESLSFLLISAIGLPFVFFNFFYLNVFIGFGNTRLPFKISAISLSLNIALDALFIFGLGLGICGAAIASVISQILSTIFYYHSFKKYHLPYLQKVTFRRAHLKEMLFLGFSPFLQRAVFIFIAIAMARIISNWGATAIAVQKIGVQIEALSYTTVAGFSSALTTISGQAYGAKDYELQWKSFFAGLKLAIIIGLLTSALFILFPKALFSIFISDKQSLSLGKDYLIILGYSQLFMCIELLSTGAFYGWGRTSMPAIISVILTALRIPFALFLTACCAPNLNTVWWSISISSIAKGLILTSLFIFLYSSFLKRQKI